MTSTLAATNEDTLLEATVAFLTEHLGHRICTYNRHRAQRSYWTHAHIDTRADLAYEPYERPYRLTGPDTDTYGPARAIRSVFAEADELTCTDCRTSRDWTHAHAAALTGLKALAAPYLANTADPGAGRDHRRDAAAMARLIATLTGAL
jgi:hypothetical protein